MHFFFCSVSIVRLLVEDHLRVKVLFIISTLYRKEQTRILLYTSPSKRESGAFTSLLFALKFCNNNVKEGWEGLFALSVVVVVEGRKDVIFQGDY